MNIHELASQFLKLAKTVGVTTFHGTEANNINNIIDGGLLAKHPKGTPHALKAVYLTNNVATAARYCRDSNKPVILEIYISSPKRVNKLNQDALDADESLYENYDNETFYNEDVRRIERAIKSIFNTKSYSCPIKLPDEIEGFRGFDLYGAIKYKARENGMNLEDVKKKMTVLLPAEDLEYLKIGDSGTISLLPSVYDVFHQMTYTEDLPAKTIKAVWIPKNKLKEGVAEGKEEQSFGRRLIPADIRPLQRIIDRFRNAFYGSDIELGDMEDVIDELDKEDSYGLFKAPNRWGPSFIDRLKLIRDRFEIASEDDQKEIKSTFYSEFQELEPLDAGAVASTEIWVRIPCDIDSLRQVNNLYVE